MLRSGRSNFSISPTTDLFAMSGLDQPGSALVLNPGAVDPHHRVLAFILPTDPHHTTWNGKRYSKAEARKVPVSIPSIRPPMETDHNSVNCICQDDLTVNSTNEGKSDVETDRPESEKSIRVCNRNGRKQFLSSKPLLEKLMMVKNPSRFI
jgi:Xaa-Pro aminopeptidase